MTTDPTPESVEALAKLLEADECRTAAATLRALSARLAEVEAERDSYHYNLNKCSDTLCRVEDELEEAEARADAAEARLREVRENVGMLYNSGVLKEEYHGPFAVVMALLNEETPART